MPELTRKELKQRSKKGEFFNIYLLYGEEKMYIKADTDFLVAELAGKEPPEFNYHSFERSYSLDDIAVAVQVAPFLSERNVVKVCDLDINSLEKENFDKLKAILDGVPDTTALILTMPTLEQSIKKPGANLGNVITKLKKKGAVCAYARESDISLARQIVKWADSRGIKIEQADAYKLQEYVGDDLYTIKNELDKLCNYVGDRGLITGDDIDFLVAKRLEADVFALADAIAEKKSDKAFSILDALFYQKADPESIISVIGMAYIDFYRVRIAAECGVQLSEVAKDFSYGKREFVLKKTVPKIRNITTDALRKSLDAIVETTGVFHSVTLGKRTELEKLIAKLLVFAGER